MTEEDEICVTVFVGNSVKNELSELVDDIDDVYLNWEDRDLRYNLWYNICGSTSGMMELNSGVGDLISKDNDSYIDNLVDIRDGIVNKLFGK